MEKHDWAIDRLDAAIDAVIGHFASIAAVIAAGTVAAAFAAHVWITIFSVVVPVVVAGSCLATKAKIVSLSRESDTPIRSSGSRKWTQPAS
jgi:hypothetical protein